MLYKLKLQLISHLQTIFLPTNKNNSKKSNPKSRTIADTTNEPKKTKIGIKINSNETEWKDERIFLLQQ